MSGAPFIALEGIDGTGKSTQCRLLADWLRGRGYTVTQCADPGGTPLGDKLRRPFGSAPANEYARRSSIIPGQSGGTCGAHYPGLRSQPARPWLQTVFWSPISSIKDMRAVSTLRSYGDCAYSQQTAWNRT